MKQTIPQADEPENASFQDPAHLTPPDPVVEDDPALRLNSGKRRKRLTASDDPAACTRPGYNCRLG